MSSNTRLVLVLGLVASLFISGCAVTPTGTSKSALGSDWTLSSGGDIPMFDAQQADELAPRTSLKKSSRPQAVPFFDRERDSERVTRPAPRAVERAGDDLPF